MMKWKVFHSIGLLILIVIIGLTSFSSNTILSWLGLSVKAVMLIWFIFIWLIISSIALIGHGITGRVEGFLIDSRNKMSLSRLQAVVWMVVVLATLLTAVASNFASNALDPLAIRVPPGVWGILGISISSLVGAGYIKSNRASDADAESTQLHKQDISLEVQMPERLIVGPVEDEQIINPTVLMNLQDTNVSPEQARLSDLFMGELVGSKDHLDLGKTQMFFFTLLVAFAYGVAIASSFTNATGTVIETLPQLSPGILALLAISHVGYLATKYASFGSIPAQSSTGANYTASDRRIRQHIGTSMSSLLTLLGRSVLLLYLAVVLGISFVLILAVWPNAPRNETLPAAFSTQVRYLVLVASGGALGTSLYDLTSFLSIVNKRSIPKHWIWSYLFRVLIAVPLALILYGVIRGGILTPEAGTANLNPYGILGASVLVGMFAPAIVERLGAAIQAMSGSESQVEQQVDRIGEVLGVAILDNYEGFVCMFFREDSGDSVSTADGGTPTLFVGQTYSLIMWFQPDQPEQASSGQGYALAEQILIEGGMDTSEVEFSLTPDSDGFSFRPREKQVAVPVTDTSPQAEFQFLAPEDAAPYELWVEVFQKNRLIHVISARLYVEAREGS